MFPLQAKHRHLPPQAINNNNEPKQQRKHKASAAGKAPPPRAAPGHYQYEKLEDTRHCVICNPLSKGCSAAGRIPARRAHAPPDAKPLPDSNLSCACVWHLQSIYT